MLGEAEAAAIGGAAGDRCHLVEPDGRRVARDGGHLRLELRAAGLGDDGVDFIGVVGIDVLRRADERVGDVLRKRAACGKRERQSQQGFAASTQQARARRLTNSREGLKHVSSLG